MTWEVLSLKLFVFNLTLCKFDLGSWTTDSTPEFVKRSGYLNCICLTKPRVISIWYYEFMISGMDCFGIWSLKHTPFIVNLSMFDWRLCIDDLRFALVGRSRHRDHANLIMCLNGRDWTFWVNDFRLSLIGMPGDWNHKGCIGFWIRLLKHYGKWFADRTVREASKSEVRLFNWILNMIDRTS
jgi:hypothetical protein